MTTNETTNTCCFFGHKTIEESKSLKEKLYPVIENLIVREKVDTLPICLKATMKRIFLKNFSARAKRYT